MGDQLNKRNVLNSMGDQLNRRHVLAAMGVCCSLVIILLALAIQSAHWTFTKSPPPPEASPQFVYCNAFRFPSIGLDQNPSQN